MDADGYLCITDFGLAKLLEETGQSNSFCGTPEYLAPEILQKNFKYSYPVDWWTLGILSYELIVGITPFVTGSQDNKKMFNLIERRAITFPDERHGIHLSENCRDFIGRLLDKNPKTRLGMGGSSEVMAHPWLSEIDVDLML